MTNQNEIDDLLMDLASEGMLEVSVDEEGEAFFKPTEQLEIMHPVIYEAIREAQLEEAQKEIDGLIEKGLIREAGLNEDGEMTYEVTEDGEAELSE